MSKSAPKQPKTRKKPSREKSVEKKKVSATTSADLKALKLVVGLENVELWQTLKNAFSCDSNEKFATKLLDLAQQQLKESKKESEKSPVTKIIKQEGGSNVIPPLVPIKTNETQINDTNSNGKVSQKIEKKVSFIKEIEIKQESPEERQNKVTILQKETPKTVIEKKPEVKKTVSKKRSETLRIRKIPELKEQDLNAKKTKEKLVNCENCNNNHAIYNCPLHRPQFIVSDSISLSDWHNVEMDLEDPNDDLNFAKYSLPPCLYFKTVMENHGPSVFTKINITKYTQFGPLLGEDIKEKDIQEDCPMRDIWEIKSKEKNFYTTTENMNESNWVRFLRPAPAKEHKNLSLIFKNERIFFISTKDIDAGSELLFWHEAELTMNKKIQQKTACGGCNMNFSHPIYYRIHCNVFHDLRYSLTIRKYHCKVCGVAVLGKDNIIKHAAQSHNGQGAYQCQYCKKFFLRLNYLEMHKSYGCAENPNKSKPLCDICGKKFCQPQKLKVHMKRMHGEISEVLKEFQCSACLKILGSRAALHRHLKEVHKKQIEATISCNRCGKSFQNKSNLKIHMLTHSGVKPFRCQMEKCRAAFTTKQCLQFHYKKVHNISETTMPKIERSIDYTIEAYSGVENENGDDPSDEPEATVNAEENDSISATLDADSELNDSMDSQNMDDPSDDIHSPLDVLNENSQDVRLLSPTIDNFNISPTVKIISKGSKKWIADQILPDLKNDIDQQNERTLISKETNIVTNAIIQQQQESLNLYERSKLSQNMHEFTRSEATNASLLVEAALDSVCNEPKIDGGNNDIIYSLPNNDTLADVTSYGINDDDRYLQLISPTVNDQMSSDEINETLQHNNIGMDYSFHQDDFNTSKSSFVRNYISAFTSQAEHYGDKNSPIPSPPRYDFGHTINSEHLNDDSGMVAHNLSLHSKDNMQLDLSMSKNDARKDASRKHLYMLGVEHLTKAYDENNASDNEHLDTLSQNDFSPINNETIKDKEQSKSPDLNSSIDARTNFDFRKYDTLDADSLRLRTNELDLTRSKPFDSIENRFKPYELDSNRSGFEPLLNTELQGLDMSARSFHNYSKLNRYHNIYPDLDLRVYSPPPSYNHVDILRVVSLTPPGGRHSVDMSLRSHPLHHSNSFRLLDQSRLLTSTPRHLSTDSSLLTGSAGDVTPRSISDHTTNKILSTSPFLESPEQTRVLNDRLLLDEARLLEPSRLVGEGRLLQSEGAESTLPAFGSYAQNPYHPTALVARPHVSSPTLPYHHYSAYY